MADEVAAPNSLYYFWEQIKPMLKGCITIIYGQEIRRKFCSKCQYPTPKHRDLDGAEEAKMGTLMLSSKTARITTLILRVLTAVILITSFVLLATVTEEVYKLNIHREVQGTWTMRFYHVVPYRYTAAMVVIRALYSVFQIVCGSISLAKGNDGNVTLDFYGEELCVTSKLLASGAVAGFHGTAELIKTWDDAGSDKLALEVFMNKTYAATALVLVGFIFSFVLPVLTSYALARNV